MQDSGLPDYVDGLFGTEDELLKTMREEAAAQGIPSIQVPSDVGRLLQVMLLASRARRVLELGALFGYSSILMARVLPADGKIITLEASSKHASVARQNFRRAQVSDKVELREGRGLDLLPQLATERFDLVFIDADKAGYPDYLEWSLKLTHPGSVIVADNVWRRMQSPDNQDADTRGIVLFNQAIAGDPRLVSTIIPRLDGSDAASVSVVR